MLHFSRFLLTNLLEQPAMSSAMNSAVWQVATIDTVCRGEGAFM